MLLEIDRFRVLNFAPLQGPTAAQIFARHPELKEGTDSIVFVENYGEPDERVSVQSSGVLKIFNAIGGVWTMVSWLRVVPAPVRDGVYRWVAKNRYAWFGKFQECKIPSAETKARFLP